MVDYSRDLVLNATSIKNFLDNNGIKFDSINVCSTRMFEKLLGIENCFVVETQNGFLSFEELFVCDVQDSENIAERKMNKKLSKMWRSHAADLLNQMEEALKEAGETDAKLVEQYKAKFTSVKKGAVERAEKAFDEAAARLNDVQNLDF